MLRADEAAAAKGSYVEVAQDLEMLKRIMQLLR
jgi:hypothetical protein